MNSKIISFLTLVLVLSVVQLADEFDRMIALPNCAPFNSPAYSGYLDVAATKKLHYILVTSQSATPQNDPLLLWFNGGPMCSSLLGFFQEHGPFIIDDGETQIKPNPYPWNLRANVLYIESPVGVGYTFYSSTEDWKTNDMRQSEDLYIAVLSFFKKFPEYLPNKLFISGESYAGIYVPYLAWQIYQHNEKAVYDTHETHLSLEGFLVGNGCTDFNIDVSPSFPDTVYNFNFIKEDLLNQFKNNNCFYSFNDVIVKENPPICDTVWDQIQTLTQDLNWYDLYRQTYDGPIVTDELRQGKVMIDGEEKTYKRGFTIDEYTPWLKKPALKSKRLLGDYVSDYINLPETRSAMNIPSKIQAFTECQNQLRYHSQPEGSYWIYNILKNKYKILVYSGDTDGAVVTYGTRRWIQNLGWSSTEAWRAWHTNGQVSGFIEKYDGLDFITIHGVGHMAPQWKREDTTNMITAWIHGEDIN